MSVLVGKRPETDMLDNECHVRAGNNFFGAEVSFFEVV